VNAAVDRNIKLCANFFKFKGQIMRSIETRYGKGKKIALNENDIHEI
jgi:hypothetical protein